MYTHARVYREIMLFIGKPMGRSIMISTRAYTNIYAYIYTDIHIYIYIHIHMHYTHIHAHTDTYACICTRMHR